VTPPLHPHDVLAVSFELRADLFRPLVQGLFQGSVYGLIGLGLVLLYKSNRIFNFAQGEFGSVAALVTFGALTGSFGFKAPYALACLLGIVVGTGTAVATERLVIRPLFDRPKVILVVATVGVALFLIAIETLLSPTIKQLPSFSDRIPSLSKKPYWFTMFGKASDPGSYKVTYQQVLIFAVLIVLALATVVFFRYTATGTAILAVSQEATAASLVGVSVGRISLVTWALAGFLGSVAGVLLAPGGLIAPGFVTGTALITGFAAAVLGGITSLSGAYIGGLAIGVIEKLAAQIVPKFFPTFPGAEAVTVGLVLLLVLLVRPRGLLGKEA
jgi:branched-chain amino acid transport system permease protein